MSVKTTIILWRVGNKQCNKESDKIATFTSVDRFDKEYIRKVAEEKIGFKLYNNQNIEQKKYEDLNNSFVDKNNIVEIRYFEEN